MSPSGQIRSYWHRDVHCAAVTSSDIFEQLFRYGYFVIRYVSLFVMFHYGTNCPTGNQIFAIQSDLSKQRLLAHRRSPATATFLCRSQSASRAVRPEAGKSQGASRRARSRLQSSAAGRTGSERNEEHRETFGRLCELGGGQKLKCVEGGAAGLADSAPCERKPAKVEVCHEKWSRVCKARQDLSYWQSWFFAIQSDMFKQRLLAHRRRSSNFHVFMHYDTICPAADNSFSNMI